MPGFRAGSARTRALLGVLAIASLAAVFTTRVSRKMPDFEVYRTAGARAMAAEPLYRTDDGHFQFKYLPAFAIFAAPLAMAPLAAAKGAWFAASAVLMLILLGLSLRAMPEIHVPPAALVVITFVAMAKFYAHELVLGQVNLLFGVLVVLAIVWLRSGKDAAAAKERASIGIGLSSDAETLLAQTRRNLCADNCGLLSRHRTHSPRSRRGSSRRLGPNNQMQEL